MTLMWKKFKMSFINVYEEVQILFNHLYMKIFGLKLGFVL